jgi:hypothetical protein
MARAKLHEARNWESSRQKSSISAHFKAGPAAKPLQKFTDG